MTRLVFSGSKLPSNDILYSIKCLAKSVMESIEASVESKILLRANIVTIFSENKNPARVGTLPTLIPPKDVVIDEFQHL